MRIGIIGYGNLGRGVECAIRQNPDMELVAVFTRRAPESVSILTEGALVCSVDEVEQWKDKIDVMILCGGSATAITPFFAISLAPMMASLYPSPSIKLSELTTNTNSVGLANIVPSIIAAAVPLAVPSRITLYFRLWNAFICPFTIFLYASLVTIINSSQ